MDEHRHGETDRHTHGHMDTTDQQRTFSGFIRTCVYGFGAAAGILIFLAIFNT